MTVFVIGGTGFIGYRLVRLLVARGETVPAWIPTPARTLSPISAERSPPFAEMSRNSTK